ncbi:MAG: HAD family hydrolase [Bacteriovoracaceae bacterium]
MKTLLLLFVFVIGCTHEDVQQRKHSQSDPLPSWNNTKLKKSIIDYVVRVTNKESPEFIPPVDRIAAFDNDGTLWAEMPAVQILFTEIQAQDRGMRHPPLKSMKKKELNDLFVRTHTGMTDEEFDEKVKNFFQDVKHPTLHVPFKKTVYRPQLELMKFLAHNGFKIYIVSGGTADFMRVISMEFYGVPPEQVIGSNFEHKYDTVKNELIREPKLTSNGNREAKAITLENDIGKRPVFTVGNVRGGGDIYMLRYSQGAPYLNYQLLVNHDDPKREFEYEEKDGVSLLWAKTYKWHVVSMKNDWKTIFAN